MSESANQRIGNPKPFPYPIIDCDIHNALPSLDTLLPYLPDHWCDYIKESAFTGPDAHDYPGGVKITTRPDAKPAAGPAGSDPALLREQTLDAWQTEYGILTCIYWTSSVHHEDLAASLSTAINRWQIDTWLDPEPRLRASIVVPGQNPVLAAQEIERFGDHPGFVQVILPVRSHMPYGKRHFDPIYAAATRHDLVVGIHYGGAAGHPPTPTGWPTTFLEEYSGMPQLFQSQVISLIMEGAFNRFPDLRVTLIEGGFTWIPSLMWRLDKEWKGLRHELPWLAQPPSAYMCEHIRLTTSPVDAPPNPQHLNQIIRQMESEHMLMFSTDYPHHHFDTPEAAFPVDLPDSFMRKTLADNARAWYRL